MKKRHSNSLTKTIRSSVLKVLQGIPIRYVPERRQPYESMETERNLVEGVKAQGMLQIGFVRLKIRE